MQHPLYTIIYTSTTSYINGYILIDHHAPRRHFKVGQKIVRFLCGTQYGYSMRNVNNLKYIITYISMNHYIKYLKLNNWFYINIFILNLKSTF